MTPPSGLKVTRWTATLPPMRDSSPTTRLPKMQSARAGTQRWRATQSCSRSLPRGAPVRASRPESDVTMKLHEMVDRQEAIRAELRAIEEDPGASDEKDADYVDTLIAEFDELESRRQPLAERAQKLNLISVGARNEDGIEDGDSRTPGPTQIYRNRRDPFDSMDVVRNNMLPAGEVRSRALDAISCVSRSGWVDFPDAYAERATQLAQTTKGVAKHILQTGSQEYYEAFRSYMSDPEGAGMAVRGTTLGTGSLGFMLPFVLDP